MSVSADNPTAINRVVENKNFLHGTQSEFSLRRLPDVEFFCQRVWLPGIGLKPAEQLNPFVNVPHPGDVLSFDEFEVTFMVDEYMTNYSALFEWMVKLGFPQDHQQFFQLSDKPRWSDEGVDSDSSLLILDSRGRARLEILFEDCHPVSLTGLEVDSRKRTTDFINATARFRFTKYTINRVR